MHPVSSLPHFLLGLLVLLLGSAAHATCTATGGDGGAVLSTYRFEMDRALPLSPQRNQPLPQRLNDFGGIISTSNPWAINCSGNEPSGWVNQAGATTSVGISPDRRLIYPISSLPGIGYAIDVQILNEPPSYFAATSVPARSGETRFEARQFKARVEFWLWDATQLHGGTTCLTSGSLLGTLAIGGIQALQIQMEGRNCLEVKVPTCHLQTRDIQVDMGRVMASSIQPRTGNTDAGRAFTLVLDQCDQVSSARLSFSADTSGSMDGILGLARLTQSSQTAQGVAVQLLDDHGQAVAFDSPHTYPVSGNRLAVPYAVRYIRTGTISPGKADAVMHFTVEYP